MAILAFLFTSSETSLSIIKRDAYAAIAALEINVSKESVKKYILLNAVTIHNSEPKAIQTFSKIIDEYSTIWTDQGFAKLSKEY